MGNKNSYSVQSVEESSTSSSAEVPVAGSSSWKETLGGICLRRAKKEIDVDDVIRVLNDEYKRLKAKPLIVPCMQWLGKSNVIAREKRFQGAKVQRHSLVTALLRFTKSIAYAEDGSHELAESYYMRAFTLYKLDAFDQCLDDLDRALAANCSDKLREQAMEMKKKCLRFKKEAPAKDAKMKKRVLGQIFESIVGEPPAVSSEDVETEWRNMCQFDNPRIPNASSKIRLGYDERKWRRYVEATEHLKAGEIIASQKCFSLFVENNIRYECCSYCMEMSQVLIPCQTCSEVMYCSIECRDTAFESYHRLECKIMTMVSERGDASYRPIRQLLIGTEQGAQLGNLMRRMSLPDLVTTEFPASQTFVNNYATVLRRDESFSLHRLKEYAPVVAKMILTLEHAEFFDGDPNFRPDAEHSDTLTEAQIFTAFLLLNHLVGMSSDLRDIEVLLIRDGRRMKGLLGTCYCPLYSAFNHSYIPNVEFLFRNRELVAFATRPIKKGEELVIENCPSSLKKHTCAQQVKGLLMKYGFICQDSKLWVIKRSRDHDENNLLEPQFKRHVKLEPTIHTLKCILAPMANESKFLTLPTNEILRIILDVCEWIFAYTKAPSYLRAEMQCLVFEFTTLAYDQFNSQLCSTERRPYVLYAHSVLRLLLHYSCNRR